jgi:ribosomal protein L3 glutamine methyltransferase
MTIEDLERSLIKAHSNDAWVDLIARYFEPHALMYGHGTDNATDEAYWLLRAKQNWKESLWDQAPCPELIPEICSIVDRRVRERIPLAYLVGEAWFCGLRFAVNDRVLVPRSPLAELIIRQFEPWCNLREGDRILDLGTGSGCIAVATAINCAEAVVEASDVSADAIAVANRNVAEHGLTKRVRTIQSNLFEALDGPYRLIVSNPPYVPEQRLKSLPREYGHEPVLALTGGPSGLSLVTEILRQAPSFLDADGVLVVEVGEAQDVFEAAYPNLPVTWLAFENGGEGVFVLTRDELTGYLAG